MKAKPSISAIAWALSIQSYPTIIESTIFAVKSGLGIISIFTGGIGNTVVTVLASPDKVWVPTSDEEWVVNTGLIFSDIGVIVGSGEARIRSALLFFLYTP